MMDIPIGVANSISANFQFDPLDTIEFATQSNFPIIQIYLNAQLLRQNGVLDRIKASEAQFDQVYYHAEGFLNQEFYESEYRQWLYKFVDQTRRPNFITHFDEQAPIDGLIRLAEQLARSSARVYVENYFQLPGKVAAEKNLKKYMALFTLTGNFGNPLYPVLDIPRLFHQNLEFTPQESLEWCYQLLNFFGNRRVPVLLHLIDCTDTAMSRVNFSAVGEGAIPYEKIFAFILKTRPLIDGIILEFEDKINPLKSRDYIQNLLQGS